MNLILFRKLWKKFKKNKKLIMSCRANAQKYFSIGKLKIENVCLYLRQRWRVTVDIRKQTF
jgi:hypothetical protein